MSTHFLNIKGTPEDAKAAILANIVIGNLKHPENDNTVERTGENTLVISTLLRSRDGERVFYHYTFTPGANSGTTMVQQKGSANAPAVDDAYAEFEKTLNEWLELARDGKTLN